MALTLPLAALAVLLLALAGVLTAFRKQEVPRTTNAALVAHADRVRNLPRYRSLVRGRWRRLALELGALALAVLGAALLVGRPVDVDAGDAGRRNRDVVLCLDVSGSMASIDDAVLASFQDLAERLQGERIALVAFDASAVTVFPLTDDADYIAAQLRDFRQELAAGPVGGTNVGGSGTSLVSDGLVSCVQRFDQSPERSRTVVLATDNQLAGSPLYPLGVAFQQAQEERVLVMGVVPADNTVAATEELRDGAKRTGGNVIALQGDEGVTEVADRVAEQQRVALPALPDARARAEVWPGAVLLVAGLVGAGAARRSRR